MEMFLVFREWDNISIALFFDRMEAVKYALRFDGYGVQSVDVNGDIVFRQMKILVSYRRDFMSRNELIHLGLLEQEEKEAEFQKWLEYQFELWLQEFPI